MGRQPIVITRDKNNELRAFINACAHRGATLCLRRKGNRGTFTCPFHGWTFSNDGRLLKVKDERTTEYPVQFNTNGSHDLTRVPFFKNYKGTLFGSLNPDAPSSEEHTSEPQSRGHLVCRLLLEKKKNNVRSILLEQDLNGLVETLKVTHVCYIIEYTEL